MSYLLDSAVSKLMNFSFSFFTSMFGFPLAMQPRGFGPKPKKSPKISLIFLALDILLLRTLLLPGDRGLWPSLARWFWRAGASTATTFFWPPVVTTVFLLAYPLALPVGDRASLGLIEPRPTIEEGWAVAWALAAFTVRVAPLACGVALSTGLWGVGAWSVFCGEGVDSKGASSTVIAVLIIGISSSSSPSSPSNSSSSTSSNKVMFCWYRYPKFFGSTFLKYSILSEIVPTYACSPSWDILWSFTKSLSTAFGSFNMASLRMSFAGPSPGLRIAMVSRFSMM